jgi:hypothetical protein
MQRDRVGPGSYMLVISSSDPFQLSTNVPPLAAGAEKRDKERDDWG